MAQVAGVIPFFSPTFLPEQRGGADQVLDFRRYAFRGGGSNIVNGCASQDAPDGSTGSASAQQASPAGENAGSGEDAGSGESGASGAPRARAGVGGDFDPARGGFFCVRLTQNGVDLHQLCDPNSPAGDPMGRTTGVVRAAVETWWNDLKRGHFVDLQTRAVQITFPLRNNNIGLRSRMQLLFEFTSYGAVLPSYDISTRVEGNPQVRSEGGWGASNLVGPQPPLVRGPVIPRPPPMSLAARLQSYRLRLQSSRLWLRFLRLRVRPSRLRLPFSWARAPRSKTQRRTRRSR